MVKDLRKIIKVELSGGIVVDLVLEHGSIQYLCYILVCRNDCIDQFMIENNLPSDFRTDIEEYIRNNLGDDNLEATWQSFGSLNIDGVIGKLSSMGLDVIRFSKL